MLPHMPWDRTGNILFFIFTVVLSLNTVFSYSDSRNRHQNRPRFLSEKRNFTYTAGETATLLCRVEELGTKTVSWKKGDSLNPLTIGPMTFTSNSEYSVQHPTPDSREWNLLIKNVQPKHEGEYECQISTKDKMKRTVYLKVLEAKDVTEQRTIAITGRDHIDKGQPLVLICNANATRLAMPPDGLDWFKDGKILQSNSAKNIFIKKQLWLEERTIISELTINNSQMSDAGTYTCRVSEYQVTSIDVTILNANKAHEKRDKTDAQPSSVVETSRNNGMDLSCHIGNTIWLLVVTFVLKSFLIPSERVR